MVLRRDRRRHRRRLNAKKLRETFALDSRQHMPKSSLFLWLSTPKHVRVNFHWSFDINLTADLSTIAYERPDDRLKIYLFNLPTNTER